MNAEFLSRLPQAAPNAAVATQSSIPHSNTIPSNFVQKKRKIKKFAPQASKSPVKTLAPPRYSNNEYAFADQQLESHRWLSQAIAGAAYLCRFLQLSHED